MTGKSPRKFVLVSILSIVILAIMIISAAAVLADPPTTTTSTTTTPTTTTSTTTTTPTTTTSTTTTPKTTSTTTTATTPKTSTTTPTTTVTPPINIKPTVTGVNPGSANQGQTLSGIIVTGTGFTGAKGVSFGGGIDVTSFTVNGDTTITANIVVANHASVGTRFVTVSTPSGKGTLPAGFSVTDDSPIVTSVDSASGSQGATLTGITITGTNFTGATKVSFGGGIDVTSFNVNGDSQISANIIIAVHASVGIRFVTVVNQSGKGTDPTGFSITDDSPTVTAINPATGSQGATLTGITVTGTNFTGATKLSFGGGIDVTGFTVNGDTQISANIVIANHASVGSRFVTVVNQSGKGTDPTGFNVTKNVSIITPTTTTTTKSTTTPTTTSTPKSTTTPTTTTTTPTSTTTTASTTTTNTPTTTTTPTPTTTTSTATTTTPTTTTTH